MTIDIDQLVARMRTLEVDHQPDGWPAVQTRDISALCDAVEGVIPALDRLQERLEAGATITQQEGMYCLFDVRGEGVAAGITLRSMLINLIFVDC